MDVWTSGHNVAGYLPEAEPGVFEDWEGARAHLLAELERDAEASVGTDGEESERVTDLDTIIDQVEGLDDGEEYLGYATLRSGTQAWWLQADEIAEREWLDLNLLG